MRRDREEARAQRPRRRSYVRAPDWFDKHGLTIIGVSLVLVVALLMLQLWLQRRGPDAQAIAQAQKVDLKGFEVYLHRQGCPTRCPVYAVLLRGDGVVQYEGVELVARVGTERSTVTELEARALALAVLR